MTRLHIEFYCATALDQVIASIDAPGEGLFGSLTATTDLPVGDHEIYLRLSPTNPGDTFSFDDATLQVVVGQTVTGPGCRPPDPGPVPT